jgi:hypothetical protein
MSDPNLERRKYVRVYRNFILNYYLLSNPSALKEVSQINNISQGGMNFSVDRSLAEGEGVGIELKTPFLAESIYLQGIVLQCREKITGLIYEIRVEFKDNSTQAKEVLSKIEQYAQKESQ